MLRNRNFSEAKSKCLEIENSYINNPEFQNIFAVILFELKDLEGAKKNWLTSIKKDPTNENLKEKINNL